MADKNKSKIKELYTFYVYEEKEVEVKEESTNEKGEKVEVTKKSLDTIPTSVTIKKPTRRLTQEAELEKASKRSECLKRGIVTKSMLAKKYADSGGAMSEDEAKKHLQRYTRLGELNAEFTKMTIIEKQEDNEKLTKISTEQVMLRKEIAEVEANYSSLFEYTVDTIASRHEILFYILMLTAIKNPETGELEDFYKGETFEEKLEDFYNKEDELDEDEIYYKIRQKVGFFISFWINGVASTQEQFKAVEEDIDNGNI